MSEKVITKQVKAIVCEFCDKEIDTKQKDYCYHSLPSRDGKVIPAHEHRVKHFEFLWLRPRKTSAEFDTWVRYDFHAGCFDKLMQKFLEEKSHE